MNTDLKKPCSNCPFRREGGIRLRAGRVRELTSMMRSPQGGVFACHKTTGEDAEGDRVVTNDSQHCAGATIFAVKNNNLTQWLRIATRTGLDLAKLEDQDAVFDTAKEMLMTAIDTKKTKPLRLTDIAKRIAVHLKRFENDKCKGGANWWNDKVGGTRPYYNAGAYQGGRWVRVFYIAYQGATSLSREDARKYLMWLDAGNVGRHREALKVK